MKIRIRKLKELPDALNPHNIPIGYEETREISDSLFKPPTVGERFYASNTWSTSGVQEIINERTFRTYSSIYEWEIVPTEVKEEILVPKGQPEYILCAAIWWDDGKKHQHQPKNIETGVIICGRRHHNCYAILEAITGSMNEKLLVKGREAQGFITSHDRYVNRFEGYKIAKEQKQILHDMTDMSNPILVSEDLY